MISPPDVQNVPDLWTLLERARSAAVELCVAAMPTSPDWHKWFEVRQEIDAALSQRERFVLVPKEPTHEMQQAAVDVFADWPPLSGPNQWKWQREGASEAWKLMLAAASKPQGKP